MNRIIEEIFEHRRILLQSLEKYGFEKNGDIYVLEKYIADRQMKMSIYVDSVGSIDTKVTDVDTGEEYTLFLTDVADGDFVNQVRNEYRQALTEIAENCCQSQVYKSPYTLALIDYVRDKYGDELEFLWKKFDDNAIWRRKDNKKWYGAILVVKKSKLGLHGDGKVEILDVRATSDEIDRLVDNKKYFNGYHMNKRSWLTLCLDGSCDIEELKGRLDISYDLALKNKYKVK